MSIHRTHFTEQVKKDVYTNAERFQKDEHGNIVSPNGTGQIITEDTKVDIGHKPGFESKHEIEFSEKAGLTQKEHDELFSNTGTLQLESSNENRSHKYENHDHNDAMQNVSAYAYSQNSEIAANTYINPSDDNHSGTISIVNAQTGEESTVCSYELPGNSDIDGIEMGNNLDDCYTSDESYSDSYADADSDSSADSADDSDSDSL